MNTVFFEQPWGSSRAWETIRIMLTVSLPLVIWDCRALWARLFWCPSWCYSLLGTDFWSALKFPLVSDYCLVPAALNFFFFAHLQGENDAFLKWPELLLSQCIFRLPRCYDFLRVTFSFLAHFPGHYFGNCSVEHWVITDINRHVGI